MEALADREYHETRRPTYQIAPALVGALQNTNLAIDSAHLRLPHCVFGIEVPVEGPGVFMDQNGHKLSGLMVGAIRRPEKMSIVDLVNSMDPLVPRLSRPLQPFAPAAETGKWNLIVVQCWEGEERIAPMFFLCTMIPGQAIEESVDKAAYADFQENPESADDGGARPDVHTQRRMIRLAIGSALFAIGANNRFTERVPEPRATKRRRQRAEKKGREPER